MYILTQLVLNRFSYKFGCVNYYSPCTDYSVQKYEHLFNIQVLQRMGYIFYFIPSVNVRYFFFAILRDSCQGL